MLNFKILFSPAVLDSLAVLCIVVETVCVNNGSRIMQDGLAGFLSIRITPLNASFCFVFVVLWNQCVEMLGLYQNDFRKFTSLMAHPELVLYRRTLG
jgi:hypothetical protein